MLNIIINFNDFRAKYYILSLSIYLYTILLRVRLAGTYLNI